MQNALKPGRPILPAERLVLNELDEDTCMVEVNIYCIKSLLRCETILLFHHCFITDSKKPKPLFVFIAKVRSTMAQSIVKGYVLLIH